MAFGVLFDFTGNSNVSKVIKAADMVKQSWFINAINFTEPIDLFMIIGHNPIRPTVSTSTFKVSTSKNENHWLQPRQYADYSDRVQCN